MPKPWTRLTLQITTHSQDNLSTFDVPPGAGTEVHFGAHEVRIAGFTLEPIFPPVPEGHTQEVPCSQCGLVTTRIADGNPWTDQFGRTQCPASEQEIPHAPAEGELRRIPGPGVPDTDDMESVVAAAMAEVEYQVAMAHEAGFERVATDVLIATALWHAVEQGLLVIPENLAGVLARGITPHRLPLDLYRLPEEEPAKD